MGADSFAFRDMMDVMDTIAVSRRGRRLEASGPVPGTGKWLSGGKIVDMRARV